MRVPNQTYDTDTFRYLCTFKSLIINITLKYFSETIIVSHTPKVQIIAKSTVLGIIFACPRTYN